MTDATAARATLVVRRTVERSPGSSLAPDAVQRDRNRPADRAADG